MSNNNDSLIELKAALEAEKKALVHAQTDQHLNLIDEVLTKMNEPVLSTDLDEGLLEHWNQKTAELETDHPDAARLIREVMDILGKMGI
ncbi:DUF4404 family protein [Sessilibacter sp. MAH2]